MSVVSEPEAVHPLGTLPSDGVDVSALLLRPKMGPKLSAIVSAFDVKQKTSCHCSDVFSWSYGRISAPEGILPRPIPDK